MRRRLFSLERVDGQVGRVLGTLQMQLHRCGGPNDGGIDLQVSEEVVTGRGFGQSIRLQFHW